jgi:hypothetical protein
LDIELELIASEEEDKNHLRNEKDPQNEQVTTQNQNEHSQKRKVPKRLITEE